MIALPTATQIEKLSPNGVSSWIESLQSGSLHYPVEETARALAALYNRRQQYLELTQSASAKFSEQQAAISGATANIQAQAQLAEAELADARAARRLIEQAQAETVAEIEAVGVAMKQLNRVRQASLDELNRVLDASKPSYKPAPVDSDFKAELDAIFAPMFADLKQSKPRVVKPQPPAQINYQPTYRPAYLSQAVHRPTPEQEMANALSAIILSLTFMLGTGGIALTIWLSDRQVLSAPSAEAGLSEPAVQVAASAPTYDPALQSAVNQARSLDAPSRQAWLNFCTQTNDGQGYSQNEQQFCQVLKFN